MNKITIYQVVILVIILQINSVLSAETNTGIIKDYGISVIKISDFFSIDDGYTDQNNMPRMICDVDGNGNNDIVGFKDDKVFISFHDGTNFQDPVEISSDFTAANGYSTQDTTPRFCADVDGDGLADIIGIKSDGVHVAYSNGQGGNLDAPFNVHSGFGSGSSWQSTVRHPRFITDIDGDNQADVIGINDSGIQVAYSNGRNGLGQPISFTTATEEFRGFAYNNGGWISNEIYPRFIGNINTSLNTKEVIGFGDGVQVVFYQDRTNGLGKLSDFLKV